MSEATTLLWGSDLRISYGDREALRGVDVGLASGELVALLGPNGSGKSTLIQSLFGHLRAEGKITWFGKPLAQWTARNLARKVAYLPQIPGYQPGQTVRDVLNLGRSPYWAGFGLESARDAEVVAEVTQQLELGNILHRSMDELSGGQRQRVFVGRCLAQEPAVMLLDEPNTYLDLKHQVELCQLLRRLSRERSIGILMASHDLNLAASFSDRVIVMSEGKVVVSGGVEVLKPEMLSEVYGLRLMQVDRNGGAPILIPQIDRELQNQG